jgi:hypothetical protein
MEAHAPLNAAAVTRRANTIRFIAATSNGCVRPVNVRPKGGDASACLIVRPPVDRRSLMLLTSRGVPRRNTADLGIFDVVIW